MISPYQLQKEEQLVINYQSNDCQESFGLLYERTYDALYLYIYKIVNSYDDAFDLTQESYIICAKELKHLKSPRLFRFWLYKIAKNLSLRHLKNANRSASSTSEGIEVIAQDYGLEEAIIKDQNLENLERAMNYLSKEEYDLLVSKYYNGNSISELMNSLKLGKSAVKMKLLRTRRKLAHTMTLAQGHHYSENSLGLC